MLGDHKQDWLAARLEDLDYGDIDGICAAARAYLLAAVKKTELDKALGYFENNAPRMRYKWFRSRGLFVGSGVVDALLIRSLLVPALMHLIGPANWALPKRKPSLPVPRRAAPMPRPAPARHFPSVRTQVLHDEDRGRLPCSLAKELCRHQSCPPAYPIRRRRLATLGKPHSGQHWPRSCTSRSAPSSRRHRTRADSTSGSGTSIQPTDQPIGEWRPPSSSTTGAGYRRQSPCPFPQFADLLVRCW